MNAPLASAPDPATVRHRVAHELYQKLAFASFAIWTLGCLALFILLAADNPRPVPSAAVAMMAPVLPALALWVAYRPLVRWQVARRLAHPAHQPPISADRPG